MISVTRKTKMIAALTVGLGLTTWVTALTLDEVPTPVKEALLELADGNTIDGLASETEQGAQIFEANWRADGKRVAAQVTADGTLLEIRQEVDADAVPEAVRLAAKRALSGADQVQYQLHNVVFYTVEGRTNDKARALEIRPTGQIMSAAGGEDVTDGRTREVRNDRVKIDADDDDADGDDDDDDEADADDDDN